MSALQIAKKKKKHLTRAEEYYNALRTNIQLSGENIQVIEVTSVNASEGKSTTSLHLAAAFARAGYKTLLLDADIRNSVMSGTFRNEGKVLGLTDFLTGTEKLESSLFDTEVENLFVIESGPTTPNPTALLQGETFEKMVKVLRDHFDYIIVDTAPIGLVIDAAIVARVCDGTVLVAEAGAVRRKFILKAKQQLEQTKTPFLGVILNKYDFKTDAYGDYGSYGSYGQYGK